MASISIASCQKTNLGLTSPSGLGDQAPEHDILLQAYAVAALQELPTQAQVSAIPLAYQKLLREFPELLKPDFTKIKHSVEHAIPTGNHAPVRSKARPLLPGSPKAIGGWKAWKEMIEMGIVEKVRADEQHYWSSGLHL